MGRRKEQTSSNAPNTIGSTIPLGFYHPSGLYRKIAVVAAIIVSIGSFLASMIGEGEPNYDLLGYGALGCCSLLNLAFVMEAIYNYKWIQYNEIHGLDETNLKTNYVAAVLLAIFGLTILFGNLLSKY